MHQTFLPRGPEEMTPEWFTTVFRENAILPAGEVVHVQTKIIGQDQGFTGVIARVQLQYSSDEQSAPSSVIAKLPTALRSTPSAYRTSQAQDATATRRFFERCAREVMFYQQLAPFSTLSVPRLYYGAVDDVTGRVILVLEDFQHARQGDALGGCSPQDAFLVIDQLADFHAQWWNHPQLETFSWLPVWGGDVQMEQIRYRQFLTPFLERFGQGIPHPILEILDALSTSYGGVRSRLRRVPMTLIHGDLHLDNLLFPASVRKPGVVIIDWQSVAHGRGVIDLALFLSGSLKTAVRRMVEDDLLQRYHERLRVGGVTDYAFSQLKEDCQWGFLWLLGAMVIWLGSLNATSLSGRELALVQASVTEESFTAFLDHDIGSLLA